MPFISILLTEIVLILLPFEKILRGDGMSSSFQNTGSYSKFLDQSCRGVFLGCRQRCEDAENFGYEFEMLKVYPGSEEVSYN